MSKLGKIWTDSVAYVALIIGAGLSVAGNIVDTFRVRGQATDVLDIVMAAAWPGLVVLMVELFVSSRWTGQRWPLQVVRWAGTVAIGAIAMRVSWVHLNDLMASRGQKADVAILGPLAIDLLAIMATAMILAGRTMPDRAGQSRTVATEPAVRTASTAGHPDAGQLDTLADEASSYLERMAMAVSGPSVLPVPVSPAPARAPRGPRTSLNLAELARVLDGLAPHVASNKEADELAAGHYGVSARTVRRARATIEGRPVSGAPMS